MRPIKGILLMGGMVVLFLGISLQVPAQTTFLENENYRIGISLDTGEVFYFELKKPVPRVFTPRLGIVAYDLEKGIKFKMKVASHHFTQEKDEPTLTLSLKSLLMDARLIYQLKKEEVRLKAKLSYNMDVPRAYLIIFGDENTPFKELFSYPFAHGVADTGDKKLMVLGRMGRIYTEEKFSSPTLEADLIIERGSLNLLYNWEPRRGGYLFGLRGKGKSAICWKATPGGWVTSGKGLGGRKFSWEKEKRYTLRIEGGKGGFSCWVGKVKLFEVKDDEFKDGSVGVSTDER